MNHEKRTWLGRGWPVLVVGGLVLLAVLYSVFGEVGILGTLRLHGKEEQLIAENARLREENEKLRQEVEKLRSNPSYIEEIARRELGLMGKKEIVIPVDRNKEGGTPLPAGGGKGRP